MTLDIIIYLMAAIIFFAAFYGIIRLKGVWIICALLYGMGGILSSAAAYLVFYPVFSTTHFVFLPGITGFFVWSAFFLRLFLPDKFSIRSD
ncbi:MAG: hypothetical protein PHC61_19340 [Chitinivibrionales bacterium]|nr:hypothetical protein [Chitinivibrionales bacterium]